MTLPALPAKDSNNWYGYEQGLRDYVAGLAGGGGGGGGGTVLAAVTSGGSAAANSTALNDAVAAAPTGGTVVIPPGTFDHNGFSFPATGRVTVRGSGRGSTVLRNVHATNASVSAVGAGGGTNPSDPYCIDWALTDLTLDASAVRAGQAGVNAELAVRFKVRDINVINHGIGLRSKAAWECTWDTVSAYLCTTGWLFASPSPYTVSCPVTVVNGSALSCGTAIRSEDSVETLAWHGGDFSGCGTGAHLTGNQTRLISFAGVNFEGITGDDVIIGDDTTGPASVAFNSCRFSRPSLVANSRSAQIVRGVGVKFDSCWWGNYATGIAHGTAAGDLMVLNPSGFNVTEFINTNGVVPAWKPLVVIPYAGSVFTVG